jgi:uncharacterized membrane protein
MNQLWVRILFVVSLVLNVFLIGAAVGVFTLGAHLARDRGHERGPPPGPGAGGQLWRASQGLPPEQARAFRQALRREAIAMRPQAQANLQVRMEAWRTGTREPFDPAAVKAALARARAGDQAARARIEERLVDLAAALPADQRRRVFEIMSEPPPRGMRRGLRGGPGPMGPPHPPGEPAVNAPDPEGPPP